jgi:hypothetical protein
MRSAAVVVAILLVATVARADEWFEAKTYTFKAGHVAARFPQEPEVDSQTRDTELGKVTVGTASLEQMGSGVQLVLSWTKYPAKRVWGTSKEELDAFTDDLAQGGKIKVQPLKDLKVSGHPARQYRIVGSADVSIVQIVLAKPWIYFMAVRVPTARASDYPYGAFLSSLKLL